MISSRAIDALERQKYAAIWEFPEYREHSPGLKNVPRFVELINPAFDACTIDIGCGEGKAGLELQNMGLKVWWLDICGDQLSPDIDRSRFMLVPIWNDWKIFQFDIGFEYGFCCDVLEHIPTEFVMLSVQRMIDNCNLVYLSIATRPDVFGPTLMKQQLHLTVRDFVWWRDRLSTIAKLHDARDLMTDGLFIIGRK